MQRKNITIGLFGFGCVGYGLYEVLQRTPGLKATIKRICVRTRPGNGLLQRNISRMIRMNC
jgi:homoserine dehydrogenase